MKYLALIMFSGILIFSACTKNTDLTCHLIDSRAVAPESEQTALRTYLDTNHITATLNPSGFYYNITSQGNGKIINNLCSNISVSYKGKFINGTVFDTTATGVPISFQLGGAIVGWQKGVPLITEGGKITLYIPPSLGYGPDTYQTIPGNSYLIFDIELVGIAQ